MKRAKRGSAECGGCGRTVQTYVPSQRGGAELYTRHARNRRQPDKTCSWSQEPVREPEPNEPSAGLKAPGPKQ